MDNTHIYAIVAAGLVSCLLLRRGWPSMASHLAPFYFRVSKFLAYRYVLRRHALIGPWTALAVLTELIYLVVNVLCLALGAAKWSQIGQRAGTLSVIHLGLLSSGLNLSFLASLLGLSLGTVRAIHHSAGFMTLGLVGCHIVVAAATDEAGFQREALKPFGLTVREHPVDASPMLTAPGRFDTVPALNRPATSRPEAVLRSLPPSPPGGLPCVCVFNLAACPVREDLSTHRPLYLWRAAGCDICRGGRHGARPKRLLVSSRLTCHHHVDLWHGQAPGAFSKATQG